MSVITEWLCILHLGIASGRRDAAKNPQKTQNKSSEYKNFIF